MMKLTNYTGSIFNKQITCEASDSLDNLLPRTTYRAAGIFACDHENYVLGLWVDSLNGASIRPIYLTKTQLDEAEIENP
jgi:hypothetical protein